MRVRFAIKAALCLTVSAIACATTAYADNGYQPYYVQDNRDSIQYSHVSPPQTAGVPAPVQEVPGHDVPYQRPEVTVQQPASAPRGPALPLGTLSGLEIGGQGSYEHYNESGNHLTDEGARLGVTLAATQAFTNDMFVSLEGRFAYGNMDTTMASASSRDHQDETYEFRALIGHDSIWYNKYDLSPYLGLGFYEDDTDGRGTLSDGTSGYRRENEYLYLPIGIKPQARINGTDRVTADLEYDYFIQGQHTSYLGDMGHGDPTLHYQDGQGFGARANLMYETGGWAFGPFVNYWNASASSRKTYYSPGATCGNTNCSSTEPPAITVEGGLQLKYRFGTY